MYDQRTKPALVSLIWFAGMISSAGATPLPEQVSAARADVDTLAERLESQRLTVREELSGLRAERAELQRQVRLEQIRRDTLARLFAERTTRMDDEEGRLMALLSPIQRSITAAKTYVSATLPFKREERLRRLIKIEKDLAVTHPDLGRTLTRIWRFVEEEEAMAREIGLAQQVIELEGKRLLVDVARIGMGVMYFRLPSGELGWVRRITQGWRFELVEGEVSRSTIAGVFDAFEKNQFFGSKRLLISSELPPSVNRDLQ
jgi:hypothetical protein